MSDDIQEIIEQQAIEAVQEQAEQIAENIEQAAEDVLTLGQIKGALTDIFTFISAIQEQLGEVHNIVISIRDNQVPIEDAIQVASAALETADEVAASAVEVIDDSDELIENLAPEIETENEADEIPDGLPTPEIIETPALDPQPKSETRKRIRMI